MLTAISLWIDELWFKRQQKRLIDQIDTDESEADQVIAEMNHAIEVREYQRYMAVCHKAAITKWREDNPKYRKTKDAADDTRFELPA